MPKWRDEMFEDLVPRAQQVGIATFDREIVTRFIEQQANVEVGDGYTKTLKKHYMHFTAFAPLGRKKFLNAVEKIWPGYVKPLKRIYSRKKTTKKEPPPPPPPPSSSVVLPPPQPPPLSVSLPPPPPPPPPGLSAWGTPEPLDTPEFACIACSDTRVSSRGTPCVPCLSVGRSTVTSGDPESPPPPASNELPPPPPPPPPPEQPLPPPAVGQTYGPGGDDAATLEHPQSHRCCISVRLHAVPALNLDKAVVTETLHRYVVGETQFGANIRDAAHLYDNWWDLLVEYSVHIANVYEVLLAHEWVEDGVAKPAPDFGVRTGATT